MCEAKPATIATVRIDRGAATAEQAAAIKLEGVKDSEGFYKHQLFIAGLKEDIRMKIMEAGKPSIQESVTHARELSFTRTGKRAAQLATSMKMMTTMTTWTTRNAPQSTPSVCRIVQSSRSIFWSKSTVSSSQSSPRPATATVFRPMQILQNPRSPSKRLPETQSPHFTLFSDHKPLEKLGKVHTRTLTRLQEAMNTFDFEIVYKKGSEMPADFLSRNVIYSISWNNEEIQQEQQKDPLIKALKNYLLNRELPTDTKCQNVVRNFANDCFVDNEIVWRRIKRQFEPSRALWFYT
jgi:hypothetical protein